MAITGSCVEQTSDGGYIVIGPNSMANEFGSQLIKTDASGTELWRKEFRSGRSFRYVQQTSDGGYIIACSGSGRDNLIKTDFSGNELWNKTFAELRLFALFPNSVQQTNDGGYIVTGYIFYSGNLSGNAYLIKADSSGNKEGVRTFGGSGDDMANSVQQTSDGGYIIAGYSRSYGAGGKDVWLIKTDPSGNMQWDKTFGGSNDDEANSVQQTSDGGYIIAGWTKSYGAGNEDVWLIKTDANGNAEK